MKSLTNICGSIFILSFLLLPVFSFAQIVNPPPAGGGGKYVPVTKAEGTGITYECVQKGAGPGGGDVYGNCGYNNLIEAVKGAIDWMVMFALAISVVAIAWAGFLYMQSGANPGKRAEANKMLWKIVMGILIMLSAWLIVTLIANSLLTGAVKNQIPLNLGNQQL